MTDHQNIATGLTGDPVAFGSASGVTINRNLAIEVVPDGSGDMKLNIRPDGTVRAFINFEDSF